MEVCEFYIFCCTILHFLLGSESFSVNGGGHAITENLVGFVDRSGQLYEGGEYVLGQGGRKVFKDEILSSFAKVSKKYCCRQAHK